MTYTARKKRKTTTGPFEELGFWATSDTKADSHHTPQRGLRPWRSKH